MNINFYLDSKLNRQNKKRVICYLRNVVPNKTIYLKTKILIIPTAWNAKKQTIRTGQTNTMEDNKYLLFFKENVSNLVTKYQIENDIINPEELKSYILENMFKNFEPRRPSVYEVFDLYMDAKKNELALSSYQKYFRLKKHLIQFEKYARIKVSFQSFDSTFYDKFLNYGLNYANQCNNSIYKLIKQLKSFLYWAADRGYMKDFEFRKFKTKEYEKEIQVLTREELFVLYDLDLTTQAKLNNIRDVFCFACFTGQRFSDIFNIRREDINGTYWHLRTQKTNDIIKLPLSDFAMAILEKYKDSPKPLPVISNQKSNEFVKELCKFASLDRECRKTTFKGGNRIDEYSPIYKLVTTHTARRTFITLSLEKGMAHEVIMAMTAHKSYKTLKKYIKISEKAIEVEMDKVWKAR